jgi:ribosomal protein S12 methylthiotransferase
LKYWIETLGCPKNQVDSDKLEGLLVEQGYDTATSAETADLVVVNTCAFIEAAREESIETVLTLAGQKAAGAKLVVTGCLAERYHDELQESLPEVDVVAGFGESFTVATPVTMGRRRVPSFDLLNLPRPASRAPWAYVKVAEGCDRRCGFCAIPSFRGDQRSRTTDEVTREVEALVAGGVREIVLVAQDLASWGHDRRRRDEAGPLEVLDVGGRQPLIDLVALLVPTVPRVRLLYLYPSSLTAAMIEAILSTNVPYFDLSLQHVSRPLLRAMNRWGSGERFLERIEAIRAQDPRATFRSSFILGYPGETETDQSELLSFLEAAQLDWAGFFPFSREAGTPADQLGHHVPAVLAMERLREVSELQDEITARRRDALVGTVAEILVDAPGVGRSVREAPEIDGIIHLDSAVAVGKLATGMITASRGVDL